jgi:hypothetical protein
VTEFLKKWAAEIERAKEADRILNRDNPGSGFGGLQTFIAIFFGWIKVLHDKKKTSLTWNFVQNSLQPIRGGSFESVFVVYPCLAQETHSHARTRNNRTPTPSVSN